MRLYKSTHYHHHHQVCIRIKQTNRPEKLSLIEDRGQTDTVTTLPRPHALDFTAAAGVGRATTHASPCKRAADDVTVKTYCYSRQSILNADHNPNP